MSYSIKSLKNAPVILVTLHSDFQPGREDPALLADFQTALDQANGPRVVVLDSFVPGVAFDDILRQPSAAGQHAKIRTVFTVAHPTQEGRSQPTLDKLVFPHAYEAVDYARRYMQ